MLERDGQGLNLSEEVRDGILNHTGPVAPATLEGKIVKLVDRIAYINHDIDDAIRAGVLELEQLPPEPIALLGRTGSQRIDTLVHDLVEASERASDIVQTPRLGESMLDCAASCSSTSTSRHPRREKDRADFVVRSLFDRSLRAPRGARRAGHRRRPRRNGWSTTSPG